MKNFRELIVWQKSIQLVAEIYKTTNSFPESEKFGLTSQMCRSAISIPSNIAEGYASSTKKEYARFLTMARSSAAELETQIIISFYAQLCLINKRIMPRSSDPCLQKVTKLKFKKIMPIKNYLSEAV